MNTQHETDKEKEISSRSLPSAEHTPDIAEQMLPQPPQQPPHKRLNNRWSVFVITALLLALVLSLGMLLLPGLARSPGGLVSPTSTSSASRATPTVQTTPGAETTPTPFPGVILGPQVCPAGVSDAAYWQAVIGISDNQRLVERVQCANIMDTPSLQALVLVRHTNTNATLDVYVFNNITSAKPIRIFLLQGLLKGDAKISGYNTLLTAEVDQRSALNTGKVLSAMTPDLFREFDWSTEQHTLIQTAFPGIFPDLTRYQAEADQISINAGHQPWKNDVQAVAKAVVTTFFDWKRPLITKIVSGGGLYDVNATVQVQEAPLQGAGQSPSVTVTLSHLEGNIHNFWVVIAVEDSAVLSLTNINARSLITSPVTLQGKGAAFEAVIGRAVVYDHQYQDIGHAQVTGEPGMGLANYSINVLYETNFRTGVQEGIVAVYEANGGISDEIYTAVMRKVLLSPEPGVALGQIACASAISDPAHWTPFISIPPNPAVAERVVCGNMLGKPGLQAMVVAHEIVGGGPLFRSVFIFDAITTSKPTLLFSVTHMLHGDAQLSGYSTILTAEVDSNSPLNAGKANAQLTTDLFREFKWSDGAGTFVQVAFPGIFPDLTRYQAETDQRLVNGGQDVWKNDPVQVAAALAKQFFSWKRTLTTTIVSGGGAHDVNASVLVQEAAVQGTRQGPSATMMLSRLEGNTHNLWEVIAVQDGPDALTNIQARQLVSSPVTLEGRGNAFENTLGVAYILDHWYTPVGQAIVSGNSGVGMGNSTYSIQVGYQTSFKRGPQEGIVELLLTTPIESDPYAAVLVKVLLAP